jgi:hypothetical protein
MGSAAVRTGSFISLMGLNRFFNIRTWEKIRSCLEYWGQGGRLMPMQRETVRATAMSGSWRVRKYWFLVVCLTVLVGSSASTLRAQTASATLSGTIMDPNGEVVPGVEVSATNIDTEISMNTKTNGDGIYVLPALQPGHYRVIVTKAGFKQIALTDVVLNVQDTVSRNFSLEIGAVSETVTVTADSTNINTTDASVSTVIDRGFVENLPLNGRSFNTLLQLTPGVVIAQTQGAAATGQFNISGQRTDANSFTVDGVSANFGVTAGLLPGQAGTGTSQAFSALGGTSSLVSVDALQEFRIETSSFAPEFGRSPGGQVILVTRSGSNDFHGGVFDYFRNTVLDANDWFANDAGQPRAAEQHNDFGGFLGGPVWKDNTFFFISYEGARLRLPDAQVIPVPSEFARTQVSPVAPLLNSFPQPDDRSITPGVYTSNFTGVWSNSATLDAGSVRIDHTFNDRFSIFGRYNDAPSETADRVNGLSVLETGPVNTQTLTIGMNMVFSSRLSNSLRGNYSTQFAAFTDALTTFGGAVPLAPSFFLGTSPSATSLLEYQTDDTDFLSSGRLSGTRARQFNFVDDLSYVAGTHQLKFGADYRLIYLDEVPAALTLFFDSSGVQNLLSTEQGELLPTTRNSARVRTQAFSLYGQDSWKLSQKATLTFGLRWELNPAPVGLGATTLAAWENTNTPAAFALAPVGTAPWSTRFGNLAPRIALAYSVTPTFIVRGGWGIFYDTGLGGVATLSTNFPNGNNEFFPSVSVPIADVSPYVPVITSAPPYPGAFGFASNLKLPRSYQWNLALEKSLPGRNILSVTYVGQAGRDLLRNAGYYQPNPNFSSYFYLTNNSARSNYSALQVQYRRPLAAHLQALASYTWSHSLDNSSNDVTSDSNTISGLSDYSQSDFDVRQSFSGALTYQIPGLTSSHALSLLTQGWSLSSVIVARSGFPFNGRLFVVSPVLGYAYIRPNLVPGQPLWIANSTAAGGKSLNPAAFTIPPPDEQGTEPRNDIPGFGLAQQDLSIGRRFALTERLNLQFRADAFNLLNHPNFTNPSGSVQFASGLQSQEMLNQGLGGLSAIFQEGGPRSLQLSLRLTF